MSNDRHRGHRGDTGFSDLLSGPRRPKHDPVFECLGWMDELSSAIGLLRVELRAGDSTRGALDGDLRSCQLTLSRIMALVAGGGDSADVARLPSISALDVDALERRDDALRGTTTIGRQFPVPGDGSHAAALADVARARCRTAERAFVAFLSPGEATGPDVPRQPDLGHALRYLNRLSGYLFVVARYLESQTPQG